MFMSRTSLNISDRKSPTSLSIQMLFIITCHRTRYSQPHCCSKWPSRSCFIFCSHLSTKEKTQPIATSYLFFFLLQQCCTLLPYTQAFYLFVFFNVRALFIPVWQSWGGKKNVDNKAYFSKRQDDGQGHPVRYNVLFDSFIYTYLGTRCVGEGVKTVFSSFVQCQGWNVCWRDSIKKGKKKKRKI